MIARIAYVPVFGISRAEINMTDSLMGCIFVMTVSRLVIYTSLLILHEMCHLGKRSDVELALILLMRITSRLANLLWSFLRGCLQCLRCLRKFYYSKLVGMRPDRDVLIGCRIW